MGLESPQATRGRPARAGGSGLPGEGAYNRSCAFVRWRRGIDRDLPKHGRNTPTASFVGSVRRQRVSHMRVIFEP